MKLIHPRRAFRKLRRSVNSLFWYYLVPDSLYLRYKYKKVFGCRLNLKNPQKFSEKIQWLKLYDRNPLYHTLVDKAAVKDWVARKIGEEYVIPTYQIWDRISDVDFGELPNQFVIKCTHDAASWSVCLDKDSFNKEKALEKLQMAMKQDYYHYENKQWVYKDIPRRIIAEKFIKDSDDVLVGLTDYKFFCFNGIVDCVMIAKGRETGNTVFYFFDRDWNLLRYNNRGKEAPDEFTLPKPYGLDKMFEIAGILAEGFKFVRVDLYNSNGTIYFGEMTFNPDGGMDSNLLPETDKIFGEKLRLC